VLGRIAGSRQGARAWQRLVRLGAPLAAAAALLIAVTATWQSPAPVVAPHPVALVRIGPVEFDTGAAVSVVSFSRSGPRTLPAEESLSFGYMTLGSSPMTSFEEAPL
jgi:hypothetical protein